MSIVPAHIRAAFSAAVRSYDATAAFQRDAGERLLAGLPEVATPQRVLDLGCGTGHASTLLAQRWPRAELLAIDFALPMLSHQPAGANWQRICANAEAVPLASASVDLLWSNLTLQWCNPARFIGEAARLLRPGGVLALTTLGPNTFGEVRRAFAAVDDYRHTIAFQDTLQLQSLLSGAGLKLRMLQQLHLTRFHPDLRSLLAEVRDIGANSVGSGRRRSLMGKAAWRRFEHAYEQQRSEAGLPLSYDAIFIYAEK